jgi:DNA-binding NtrC family response regulator
MKKNVALIDDDDGPILYYEMALEGADFHVVRLRTFKEALEFILNPSPAPDMWIVDVMMPLHDAPPVIDNVETSQITSLGLGAGLLLYKKIKRHNPSVPVMLLTSISTPDLLNNIETTLENRDTCESKLDILPKRLIEIVQSRI